METLKNIVSTIKGYWTNMTGESSFSTWISGGLKERSKYQLLGEYKNLTFACISVIAEEVGKYDPVFYKKNAKGKLDPIPNHDFQTVLANPNPTMSQFELFESTQSYIELVGEAFWYLELGKSTGLPHSIDLLRPDRVEILINDKTGDVLGYKYRTADGRDMPLDVEEVIHFKTFNPLNAYHGIGTVQAGLLYIDTENSTSLFQYNFMQNQATPSGVLTLQGKITPEAFQKIKKRWKEQQAGLKNVGKTLIIRQMDAKFEKVGLSLADLDLAELKKMTSDSVLKMFRVPKPLLGEADSTGLGRANVEAVEYIFAKRTIDPKLTRIDDTLSQAVRRYYKDQNLYIEHETQVPADKEAELRERQAGVDIWIKRNEIRAADGLDPVDGGDKLYNTFNQVPIDEETLPPTSENGVANAVKVLLVKKKDPKRLVKIKEEVIHNHEHPHVEKVSIRMKKTGKNTAGFFKSLDKIENKGSKTYDNNLSALLVKQEQDVITAMKKKIKKSVDFDGEFFEIEFTKEEVKLNLVQALINSLIAAGKKSVEFVGKPDTDFVVEQGTRNSIFKSTERLMKSFNEETALKLQKQLAAGLAAGEDVDKLTKRVESIYEEAKGFRAERIAKTEAHNATNEGVAEGYLQSGVTKMQWVTQGDPCEYCAAMDGTIVEIGEPFVPKGESVSGKDGGEFLNDYQSVDYANLHPNCNCRIEPVI